MAGLSAMKAPTLGEMEVLAYEAFERLPEAFRHACEGVAIRVEDFPTDEVVEMMELESPFDLLGLYWGTAITLKSVAHAPTRPDMIFLYRRPMLDYWAEHDETLGDLIVHVLIHEIGHHLGLSDEDIDSIEADVRG